MTDFTRLRELAASAALGHHEWVFYGSAVMLPPTDKAGHTLNFTTCPHPDCQLVREPLPASSSPAPRPEGWLDGEIALTAFALAHPDCDVKAVLHGFAEWILTGSPPAWEPIGPSRDAVEQLLNFWRIRAYDCGERRENAVAWQAIGIEIKKCIKELEALLPQPPKEQP